MRRMAIQTTQRIMQKCPHCGDAATPKELVAQGSSKKLLAFCSRCQRAFAPSQGMSCLVLMILSFLGLAVVTLVAMAVAR